ncbi:MAG: BBP7 family outer membrane beta-barrel protein [Planctomycetes bacterium]|nr:BBP7 family outer membrane beta-barrel protein [Planctomycetota bacterium]
MRHYLLPAALLALLVVQPVHGEDLPAAYGPSNSNLAMPTLMAVEQSGPRIWGSADYLLWWCKPVCLKPATLTTGNRGNANPGALGQSGTNVIMGNHKFEFSGLSGARATLGAWLSDDTLSIEATGFFLEQGNARQFFQSTNGGPATYIPFSDPQNVAQALPFSVPALVNGTATAIGQSQLWGLEGNFALGVTAPLGNVSIRSDLLFGFRYLDLNDRVYLENRLSLVNDPATYAVGSCDFSTRNQFYGGQLGLRLALESGRWSILYTNKLALGETRQSRSISGSSLTGGTANAGLLPGPVLAQASNSGSEATNRFTLVPEASFKLRCQATDFFAVSLGYSCLYWHKVLCPGDQMDNHLNPSQLPGRGPVLGPRDPQPLFVHTDYFVHGLNAGFEVRY